MSPSALQEHEEGRAVRLGNVDLRP